MKDKEQQLPWQKEDYVFPDEEKLDKVLDAEDID